jgi:hypothetical protein
MTCRGMLELAAVAMVSASTVAALPRTTIAGPGEAGDGHHPAGREPDRADFVVLIWYRRNDALKTFQYQTYDVRRGEYTGAVDDWIRLMQEKHPAYLVLVRPVDLRRERGDTEKLKVGSVIYRELLLAAAQSGVILGAPMSISSGPSAAQGRASRTIQPAMRGGNDRSFLNPSPTPSIPVYPRTRAP